MFQVKEKYLNMILGVYCQVQILFTSPCNCQFRFFFLQKITKADQKTQMQKRKSKSEEK